MTTLKQLNRYIRRNYQNLDVEWVKSVGNYQFINSDGVKYPQSEIHCKCLTQQCEAKWIKDINNILG